MNQPYQGRSIGFEPVLRLVDTIHGRPDRHGCIFGDPNLDGLLDIVCAKGAQQGTAKKWNELWIQGPPGVWTRRGARVGDRGRLGAGPAPGVDRPEPRQVPRPVHRQRRAEGRRPHVAEPHLRERRRDALPRGEPGDHAAGRLVVRADGRRERRRMGRPPAVRRQAHDPVRAPGQPLRRRGRALRRAAGADRERRRDHRRVGRRDRRPRARVTCTASRSGSAPPTGRSGRRSSRCRWATATGSRSATSTGTAPPTSTPSTAARTA